MISYLCAISLQIPHADVAVLRDACEILSILGQSHRPYIQFAQIGCGFSISTYSTSAMIIDNVPEAAASADQ